MKIHFLKCLSLCLSFFKLRQNAKNGSQVNGKIRLCVPFLGIDGIYGFNHNGLFGQKGSFGRMYRKKIKYTYNVSLM